MAEFDPVWASDDGALITTPTADQIEAGFRCGPADPGLFNWLFQRTMSAINSLNIADMVPRIRMISTTEGVAGGGDLNSDLTLRLGFQNLEVEASIANDDIIAIFDTSAGAHRGMTRSDFVTGLGGEGGVLIGGENVGTGTGSIYAANAAGLLQFRRLLNAGGLTIAVASNDVAMSIADLGSELTYN